jgi:hypothetical protein
MKRQLPFNLVAAIGATCGVALMNAPLVGHAGDAPASFRASPDVYKVLAENDDMRVVLATWAPGKKDVSHSHPTAAVYTIKDCHARITTADGKVREVNNKAGAARINPPVASHTFENIGLNECQQVLIEKKR